MAEPGATGTSSDEGGGHPAVALVLCALTGLVASAAAVLGVINRPAWHPGTWFYLVDLADAVVYGIVGYLLLSRTRRAVAWIVSLLALGGGCAALASQWTERTVRDPDAPALNLLQTMQNWAWVPGTLALFTVVPWLVREGPLRPTARTFVALGTVGSLGMLLIRWTDPYPWPDGESVLPFAIHNREWAAHADTVMQWWYAGVALLGMVAAAHVTVRWSRQPRDRRRGLGWLAIGTALLSITFTPLALPERWVDWLPANFTPITHLASQQFFPAALLVAVLGQQLWGLRLAVSRTIAWSLLTAVLIAGYVGLVALSGTLFDVEDGVEQVAVTALLAGLIEPLRRFVQRRVDRLVLGDASEPFRVVRRVGRRIGAGGEPTQLLESVLVDLVTSLRLRGARIELSNSATAAVATGDTSGGDDLFVPLVLDDELIGGLHVWPRPGERIDGQTEHTIDSLAPLVAVTARLADTAVALAHSRNRITTARDEERRALRRELHDGLGPALAGVGYGLQAARNLLDSDPQAAASLLDRLIGELDARVADVRNLARELVPPVLVEDGLEAALAELAERHRMTGINVVLEAGDLPPIPPEVATSLYAVVVEALRNVVRHAAASACTVSLTTDGNARVRLAVADNGVGIDPRASAGVGTQSMRERADALGAVLSITRPPSGGTLVEMIVDLETAVPK